MLDAAAAIPPPIVVWEVGLRCGHVMLYRQHMSLHPADVALPCPSCGQLRAVATATRHDPPRESASQRAELRLQVRRADDRVAALRLRLEDALQRLADLHAQLTTSQA